MLCGYKKYFQFCIQINIKMIILCMDQFIISSFMNLILSIEQFKYSRMSLLGRLGFSFYGPAVFLSSPEKVEA